MPNRSLGFDIFFLYGEIKNNEPNVLNGPNVQRYFENFELHSKASSDEVKQAYRDLVNVRHPDRFPGNPRLNQKAEEKLKKINEAYERALSFLSSEGESEKIHITILF